MDTDIRRVIMALPLHLLERIDCAMEGDWSDTIRTVWSRTDPAVNLPTPEFASDRWRPSLELMFPTTWYGIRCYVRRDAEYRFDAERARVLIEFILRQRESGSPNGGPRVGSR